jgi:hypothetical protein
MADWPFEFLTKVLVPAMVAWGVAHLNSRFASERAKRDFRTKLLSSQLDRSKEASWEIYDEVVAHLGSPEGSEREQTQKRCLRKIKRLESCIGACKPHLSVPLRSQLIGALISWKRTLTGDPFPLGNRGPLDESNPHFQSIAEAQSKLEAAIVRVASDAAEGL